MFYYRQSIFYQCSKSLPKNPPDEPFAKVLRGLKTCVLVNTSLCRKLLSLLQSPPTFDEGFKVILVPIFVPDFNLLSSELGNFTFKVLY